MSNICAGIGRRQMTVTNGQIAHHKHVQRMYEELLAGVEGVTVHKQPVYKDAPAYVNDVSEEIFKVGMCLPAGPYVSDEDVRYIVETIKGSIE